MGESSLPIPRKRMSGRSRTQTNGSWQSARQTRSLRWPTSARGALTWQGAPLSPESTTRTIIFRGNRWADIASRSRAWSRLARDAGCAGRRSQAGAGWTWIFGTIGGGVIGAGCGSLRTGSHRAAHPVVLMQYAAAGSIINSQAMRAFEIGETEPDPLGGRYQRAGIEASEWQLFGYAESGCRKVGGTSRGCGYRAGDSRLAHQALRYGITSIQDMSFVAPHRYIRLLRTPRHRCGCGYPVSTEHEQWP